MGLSATKYVNGQPVTVRVPFSDVFHVRPMQGGKKYMERSLLAHLLENSLGHTKSSKQKRSNGRVNGPTNQATYHSSGEASGLKSGGSVGNALGIDVKAPGVRTPAAPVTTAAVQPVKNNVGPANERNDGDAKKEATFTAEQDAKILEMKNDKSTWNEIVQAIGGHSKSDIQARFKKLNAEKGPSSGNEAGKINTTETEAAKDNEARKKVQSQEPKDRANSGTKQGVSSALPGVDKATLDKIVTVRKIADEYEEDKWLAIASRYFDYTGKRMSIQEAKRLLA